MKDSAHASLFKKTTNHLFDASAFGKHDNITGVSESIILGIRLQIVERPCASMMEDVYSLGSFLIHRPGLVTPSPDLPPSRKLLFEESL